MTRIGFGVLASHWRRNPWQFLTLVMGLALATALWAGVQAINTEARASYDRASGALESIDVQSVTRKDGNLITVQDYVDLRKRGFLLSPIIEAAFEWDGGRFTLVGIEPLSLPRGSGPLDFDDGGAGVFDGFLGQGGHVLAHPDDVAGLAGLAVAVKPDPSRAPGRLLADIATASMLLDQSGLNRLLFHPRQPLGVPELPEGFVLSEAAVQNDVARLTQSFHLNLTAFGLLSFAVGIFIVYGAVGLAFEQRRGVFRTLRALGVSLRRLMFLLALELGAFALIGGMIGVALGYVIAAALLPDVAATLRGLYGAEITGQLQLRPIWWASGLAMAFGGTGVAAMAAFWKLAHMPLLSFNHPRAMSLRASDASVWLGAASCGLFACGAAFVIWGQGLFAGFALLACLLVGAALALPMVLGGLLRVAARLSKGVIAQWFWADSRQQLPGLSMALMALLLAMAANIGVSTMVSSFRLTFIGYLDQRLSAELYVRAQSVEQAQDLIAFIVPHSDAILPIVSAPARIAGLPAEIYGIKDHSTYRENWPLLSARADVWDAIAAGSGALINEQLARRQSLRVGDSLPSGDEILGIYSDYGNSSGQVVIGDQLFAQRYPDARALQFGVRVQDPDALAQKITAQFNLGPEGVINQSDLKAFSVSVFERTFAVTAALNVLTLAVAGLAILISLLTLATMRLPQLAPVWALGLTRRRLAVLELVRAVALAVMTGLLAVPLGLALAWILLAIVNVEAFGWRLPMFVFPYDMVRLGGLTLVAAVVAALWPAWRLARTPPQALLKVFSNER